MINTPGHIISFTSFGKGTGKSPGEPLIFILCLSLFTTHIHTNRHVHARTHAHFSLPLPSSFAPVALAKNTAPCFSWQNSEGCPCVPEKPANVHISHIFCTALSASASLRASSHHPGSQAMQDRVGRTRPLLLAITSTSSLCLSFFVSNIHNSLSLHPNPSLWWLLALLNLQERARRVQVCEGPALCCSLMRQSC